MYPLPLVTAHDGCEAAPPHTLESVLRGLAAGADFVEVDIRLTRDGVVILQHDDSITVDGVREEVADLSYSELDSMQTEGRIAERGLEGRMTRLEEILAAAKARGSVVNLDVKEDGAIDPAVRLVRTADMVRQVVFSGCEVSRARYLRSRHRDFQVLLNASGELYERGTQNRDDFVRELCDSAVEIACCGLNIYHTFCSEQLISAASLRFLPVSVWTVDDAEMMKHFLTSGVYAITTNCVSTLRSLM